MKILLIDKENIFIKELMTAIKETTDLIIESYSKNKDLLSAQIISVDSDDISEVVNAYPDEAFHGIFAVSQKKTEKSKRFEDTMHNLSSNHDVKYPNNITVFQEIDRNDFDAKNMASEIKNTFDVHEQLCLIVKDLLENTACYEKENGKIKVYYYDWKSGEEKTELQSVDIFAQSIYFDKEGLDITIKQWLAHRKPAHKKRTAIYEPINDFQMTIYHLYGDNIIIHNDMDVFWIEDSSDPDNYCDTYLLKDLAKYYGVDKIRKIITDDEYACMLL